VTRGAIAATEPDVSQMKQQFVVSHYDDGDFHDGGLRASAQYRDLGVRKATAGMVDAQVNRQRPGAKAGAPPMKRHRHEVRFQMIYVLKGWVKVEFEGHGVHLMEPGSCWLQPPGIVHRVVDCSEDREVLEIVMPADYATVEV
jgi:mannose-6-phosphate isomerase-like protein (cupin superfamily)